MVMPSVRPSDSSFEKAAFWILTGLLTKRDCGYHFIRNLQGHLKPLGSHTPPKIDVDEFTIENAPSPPEFYEKYVKRSKAAIFRSAIKGSRAFNLWTDEYIRVHYGEMEVRLEGKHEKHHVPPVGEKYLGRDTLRHFVDTYHDSNDNTYIVSDLPSPMYKDVDVVPSLGACGEMSRRIIEVDIWWSGGGTSSILHKDAFHQMNCLVNGTKNWKLIEYKYEKYIHKHPEPESELGGFSDIDPQAVDLIEHPHISKTEWSNVTIYAGDCLYLPKSYYHQVESHGTNNLAISLLFARFDNRKSLDFSDCTGNIDYQKARPLSEYNVQLVWKGTGMMVMGRSDLEEQYRASLLKLTNDHESKGKLCNLESIEKMFWEIAPPEGQRMLGDMNKAFLIMDKNKDGYISNKEIAALTIDELRLIGDEVSMYEPSNSYKFEYSIISFENVWAALHYYLHEYDSIDRDLWISKYKLLGGTEEFGDEIFDKLSSGKTSIISKYYGR
uniref:uncharacterized protein LOC120328635 n=1 Tax=Styela clava TaxID=7725 RepID=UPI00193A2514|nr:uncharacterized protein LOC120328635 [Styela clava]